MPPIGVGTTDLSRGTIDFWLRLIDHRPMSGLGAHVRIDA
jgi:hypothetical protein